MDKRQKRKNAIIRSVPFVVGLLLLAFIFMLATTMEEKDERMPQHTLFVTRHMVMAYSVTIYIFFVMILLFIHSRTARANMRKLKEQLRTIEAIGSIYTATFLIHIDMDSWEGIKVPETLKKKLSEKHTIGELFHVYGEQYVSEAYRSGFRDFVNLDDLDERLRGNVVVSYESEDYRGNWFRALLIPQSRGRQGQLRAVVLAVHDVTKIRKKEMQYQDELRKAAAREKNANQAKTDYLFNLNQEIRSMVDVIRGSMEISRRCSNDPGRREQCRSDVIKATGYLLEVIEDIPVVAFGTGSRAIYRKAFNMRQLYMDTASSIESLAQEAGVSVEKAEFTGTHTRLIGNPNHIRQVMQYMASNVLKYDYIGKDIRIGCTEISADSDRVTYVFTCDTAETTIQEESRLRLEFTLDMADSAPCLFPPG